MKSRVRKHREFTVGSTVLTIVFIVICLAWMMPIIEVVINSFKTNSSISLNLFALPDSESFAGADNYVKGLTFGNFPFLKSAGYSLFISIVSTTLILVCCSMAAWYIVRVQSKFAKIFYYLCVFSMVVPFQMVMFTLSKVTDFLHLGNMFGIIPVYLGFGAGLSLFMFCGFIKAIPISLEEAAMIDGCTPVQTYFKVIVPMLRPTMITVAILNAMWIWNDYLLPTLVLDSEKPTIPMAVQYLRGGYGSIDMGAMMAMLVLAILPIIVFYLTCQKYIIKGVAAGAVKG